MLLQEKAGWIGLDWFIVFGCYLLTAMVSDIMPDPNSPRCGLIRVDYNHRAMLDLLQL